jgi:hypothetical protein
MVRVKKFDEEKARLNKPGTELALFNLKFGREIRKDVIRVISYVECLVPFHQMLLLLDNQEAFVALWEPMHDAVIETVLKTEANSMRHIELDSRKMQARVFFGTSFMM